MKQTHGWALPDGDIHFSEHLAREFAENGAAGYQTKKWLAALEVLRGRASREGARVWPSSASENCTQNPGPRPSPTLYPRETVSTVTKAVQTLDYAVETGA